MISVITLTTDFGTRDGFVGQIKGVMLGINPVVNIVDITHEIAHFSVREADLVLKGIYSRFNLPSVHVVVVDPGVGGSRRPLAVKVGASYLIGPDNGIFSSILNENKDFEARAILNPSFTLQKVSNTFHGRDIFAPAAAWLSRERNFSEIGPMVSDPVILEIPTPDISGNRIKGSVIHVDSFGNIITNVDKSMLKGKRIEVRCGNIRVSGLSSSYSQSPGRSAIALINSFDLLEIAVPLASAACKYGINVGAEVTVISDDSF